MQNSKSSYRTLFPTRKDVLKDVLACLSFMTRLLTCFVFATLSVVMVIPYVSNFLLASIPSALEWLGVVLLLLSLLTLTVIGFLVGAGFCWVIKHSYEGKN